MIYRLHRLCAAFPLQGVSNIHVYPDNKLFFITNRLSNTVLEVHRLIQLHDLYSAKLFWHHLGACQEAYQVIPLPFWPLQGSRSRAPGSCLVSLTTHLTCDPDLSVVLDKRLKSAGSTKHSGDSSVLP